MCYKKEKDIIGYCEYCHSEIYEDEDYDVRFVNGVKQMFHSECNKQKETYFDPFDL